MLVAKTRLRRAVARRTSHRRTYCRTNQKNSHVRGYHEEGTTATPFGMTLRNDLDMFHLVADVIDRVPILSSRVVYLKARMHDKRIEHRQFIECHGQNKPEIREWKWPAAPGKSA